MSSVIEAIGDAGKTLIIIIFGGIAFSALFLVAGQIVQNSGYVPLQTTWKATEPIVSNVSDVPDLWNFIKSISVIVGLVVGGCLGVKYLPQLIEELVG